MVSIITQASSSIQEKNTRPPQDPFKDKTCTMHTKLCQILYQTSLLDYQIDEKLSQTKSNSHFRLLQHKTLYFFLMRKMKFILLLQNQAKGSLKKTVIIVILSLSHFRPTLPKQIGIVNIGIIITMKSEHPPSPHWQGHSNSKIMFKFCVNGI